MMLGKATVIVVALLVLAWMIGGMLRNRKR
jgi:hypothetical protein